MIKNRLKIRRIEIFIIMMYNKKRKKDKSEISGDGL